MYCIVYCKKIVSITLATLLAALGIFKILFSVLFLVGTLRQPAVIAWYESGKPTVPIFDEQVVMTFLPLFIFIMIFALFLAILKIIKGRWNYSLAIVQIIYGIFDAVISIAFINKDIFTGDLIDRLADTFSTSQTAVAGYINISITVLTVLIIISLLSETGTTIYKTMKSRSKQLLLYQHITPASVIEHDDLLARNDFC